MSNAFANTRDVLVDSAAQLPHRLFGTVDLTVGLGKAWEIMTTDHERATITDDTRDFDQAARLQGALEEGLHVAVYAAGQIIRQSASEDETPPNEIIVTRIVGARGLLLAIAARGNPEAFSLEKRLGFRSETFYDPEEQLQMYGTTVSAPSVDAITPPSGIVLPGQGQTGCPFRSYLHDVIPPLAESLVEVFMGED